MPIPPSNIVLRGESGDMTLDVLHTRHTVKATRYLTARHLFCLIQLRVVAARAARLACVGFENAQFIKEVSLLLSSQATMSFAETHAG